MKLRRPNSNRPTSCLKATHANLSCDPFLAWERQSLIPVDSQSLKKGISDPCGLSSLWKREPLIPVDSFSERDNLWSLWTLKSLKEGTSDPCGLSSLWKREPLIPVDSQSLKEITSDPCGLSIKSQVSERGNLWFLWTLSLWERESLTPVDSQSLKEGISDPCGLSVSERGNLWPLWTLSLSREQTLSWLSVCHHASPPTGQRKEKQLGKPTFAISIELESLPLLSQ